MTQSTPQKIVRFETLHAKVGRFNLRDKVFLVPGMNRMSAHLLAATFRGFGIQALVMETYKGMDLGLEYTSGKECFPCQITMGDILFFLRQEKERLGPRFDPERYVYFMPEADGPCRFGMYNKYQRIILDSFPEFQKVRIGSLSTKDGYSLAGMIETEKVRDLRKVAYVSVVLADILDRLLWRIRPYERRQGLADALVEQGRLELERAIEAHGQAKDFGKILSVLEDILEQGKGMVDPSIPAKPLIGIVGEIYLRTHTQANQDVIRVLERYGAEVVNASIAEWVNYTTYERLRDARQAFLLNLRQLRFTSVFQTLRSMAAFGGDMVYQYLRQDQIYRRVLSHIDLAEDHRIAHLEDVLKKKDLFHFDVGTEACLSIAGIMEYVGEGYNGIVNVYPFACMPSTIASAVVKPIMQKKGIPYIDTPYDASVQPGREGALRTFMYQATQHRSRQGRKGHGATIPRDAPRVDGN